MTRDQLRKIVEEEIQGILLMDESQSSCRGNAKHDEFGRFSSKESDGSHAIENIPTSCERKRGQYKRSGESIGANSNPCGRKNRKWCKAGNEK